MYKLNHKRDRKNDLARVPFLTLLVYNLLIEVQKL
jgi:hypothetical protein